jgi:hypothetical protein
MNTRVYDSKLFRIDIGELKIIIRDLREFL